MAKISKNLLHKGIKVDYYIPDKNLVVEVQGIQHYQPSGFGRSKTDTMVQYANQLNRDSKLKEICEKNNIILLEVPHDTSRVDILKVLTDYV